MEAGYWLLRIEPECLETICNIIGCTPIHVEFDHKLWITVSMKSISYSRLKALRADKTIRGFLELAPIINELF